MVLSNSIRSRPLDTVSWTHATTLQLYSQTIVGTYTRSPNKKRTKTADIIIFSPSNRYKKKSIKCHGVVPIKCRSAAFYTPRPGSINTTELYMYRDVFLTRNKFPPCTHRVTPFAKQYFIFFIYLKLVKVKRNT